MWNFEHIFKNTYYDSSIWVRTKRYLWWWSVVVGLSNVTWTEEAMSGSMRMRNRNLWNISPSGGFSPGVTSVTWLPVMCQEEPLIGTGSHGSDRVRMGNGNWTIPPSRAFSPEVASVTWLRKRPCTEEAMKWSCAHTNRYIYYYYGSSKSTMTTCDPMSRDPQRGGRVCACPTGSYAISLLVRPY